MRHARRTDQFQHFELHFNVQRGESSIQEIMLKFYTNGNTLGLEYSPFREFFCNAAQIQWLLKVPKCIICSQIVPDVLCSQIVPGVLFSVFCCSYCYYRVVNLRTERTDPVTEYTKLQFLFCTKLNGPFKLFFTLSLGKKTLSDYSTGKRFVVFQP